LSSIHLGIAQFICARPLVFGLTSDERPDVTLSYDEPAVLADLLSRHDMDAALIPSIEFLRGVGKSMAHSIALVARPNRGAAVLVSQQPIEDVKRIAVNEFCRTPIAALRIVLAEKYDLFPDMLVEKNFEADWRDRYDAALLAGDDALRWLSNPSNDGDTHVYNITELWTEITETPLVLGLWVFGDTERRELLNKALILSRNLGMQNLSRLADGIAQSTQYESGFLYDYLSNCFSYDQGEDEIRGLHMLEELSIKYDLLREPRLERVEL
jgi:chorismate dehydratase